MSLRKKIIFGFSISAFIITILASFELVNFVQVRSGMRFLEVTDTIRNRSLELRRHEKNFFLFPEKAAEESAATHEYLNQLDEVTRNIESDDPQKVAELEDLVGQYRSQFSDIEKLLTGIQADFSSRQEAYGPFQSFVPLAAAYSRDKPLFVADFLENMVGLPPGDPQIVRLQQLDADINALRQTGENILTASNDLDRSARDTADRGIRQAEIAILIFFPLFLAFGLGAMLYISTDVVKRLKTLTGEIDRIGSRYAHGEPAPSAGGGQLDEVDVLIEKFNNMNTQLNAWESELEEKNQELFQSKKLAAIGTLAAGVAHELNNPLNNINISAQVLRKQVRDEDPAHIKEIVDDIVSQTARVKEIVGNLLEFAREREPRLQEIELNALIRNAWRQVSGTMDTSQVNFNLETARETVVLRGDPSQLERVFVNLFTNGVAAMAGAGDLGVRVEPEDGWVTIFVSDTGQGIPEEDREKIFDPFFTKKDKGTGLGLAIVMNVISKHGGNISVVSEEFMGTVFEITLPRGTD